MHNNLSKFSIKIQKKKDSAVFSMVIDCVFNGY